MKMDWQRERLVFFAASGQLSRIEFLSMRQLLLLIDLFVMFVMLLLTDKPVRRGIKLDRLFIKFVVRPKKCVCVYCKCVKKVQH